MKERGGKFWLCSSLCAFKHTYTYTSERQKTGAHKCAHAPGSGPLGAVAHADWFGQPAHAADFPAVSLEVPGQSASVGVRAETVGQRRHKLLRGMNGSTSGPQSHVHASAQS